MSTAQNKENARRFFHMTSTKDSQIQFPERDAREVTYAEVFARIAPQARNTLEQRFRAFVEQREAQRKQRATYEELVMKPLLQALTSDEHLRPSIPFEQNVKWPLDTPVRSSIPEGSRIAKGLSIWPLGTDAPGDVVMEDELIEFFGPPYVDQWTQMLGSPLPHRQQQALADRENGSFGIQQTLGEEGGWATSAAAVWVNFVPQSSTGQIEVRPYTRYSYGWADASYIATAHNDAGFGVYVLSWDLSGNDQTVEQDYRYTAWSDGTSWFETHNNPSYPDLDPGYAYLYGNQTPYFEVRPNRLYSAAIWCFGSCDAKGGPIAPASYAQLKISATVPCVVIGQQYEPKTRVRKVLCSDVEAVDAGSGTFVTRKITMKDQRIETCMLRS